ncbi:MAG: pyrroline-5-carboxylate reductase [Candidatus Helarchaeota archaeon]
MNIEQRKLGIVGTGNMGESIIRGLINFSNLPPENIYAADVDKEKLQTIKDKYNIPIQSDPNDLLKIVDIILIAVKPQHIEDVLHQISTQNKKYDLVISIAAGITTHYLEDSIGSKIPVIRVMPNICATVNAAISAICRGKYATNQSIQITRQIFESIGKVVEVKEDLMDVVTGLSGSGPAYIFLVIEALSDAGVLLGLPRDIATTLAAQTTLGAAKMILETGLHPAELKSQVTSPGGTTIQGLLALEQNSFRAALISAVKAATVRSRELRKKIP